MSEPEKLFRWYILNESENGCGYVAPQGLEKDVPFRGAGAGVGTELRVGMRSSKGPLEDVDHT